MKGFRWGIQDNSRHGRDAIIAKALQPLTPAQISDLACYLSRLR